MKVFGEKIKRTEDPRFLRGDAKFIADIDLPGMLHMAILRSPHGHALIKRIDPSAALKLPGVVRVVTAADLGDMMPLPCAWKPGGGVESYFPPHPEDRAAGVQPGPDQGQGPLHRRRGRGRGGRDADPGPRCPRRHPRRLRAATRCHHAEGGHRRRGAAAARDGPEQPQRPLYLRRQGRHRPGDRGGRRRRPPVHAQPAHHQQPDRAARRGRHLRPRHRGVHALRLHPGHPRPPVSAGLRGAGRARQQGAGHLAGHRWQLRHQGLPVLRHGAGDVSVQGARTPGQMGRHPRRAHAVDGAGPRPAHPMARWPASATAPSPRCAAPATPT